MAAPTLLDYQFWFGDTSEAGKVFGINTETDVISTEGFEKLNIRSGTRTLPRDDGSVPGLHLVLSKDVIFELDILGDTEYYSMLDALGPRKNMEAQLHWKFPGQDQKFMRARVFSRSDKRTGFTNSKIPMTLVFEVADPRIYGLVTETESINIFSVQSEGIEFEIDFEVDFLLQGGGGFDVIHRNEGNSDAYPLVRFFGPVSGTCTAVKLLNLTTGVDLELTTTILAGQTLTCDMDARKRGTGSRVIDLAGASRYGDWVLPRDTFYFQPGDNSIRLETTGTSTDVVAVTNWRDTSY